MASNKDILEAQRYNRRRLVNAFVAGTPNGQELAPRSPSRPLLVGAALALVLALVASVMGRFASTLPTGWENNKLVVVKDSGARYVTINGVLRPVTNVTSALLLSNRSDFKLVEVDSPALDGIARGSLVGLTDVPDQVPAAASLRSGDWVSCGLSETGQRTWVAQPPTGISAASSVLVSNQGRSYVIANGHRYLITDRQVTFALNLASTPPHPVSADWLSLFDPGSDLTPLTIRGVGQPASGMPERLSNALIGSLVNVGQGSESRTYVISGPGQITPLTTLADQLYKIGSGKGGAAALPVDVADVAGLKVVSTGIVPADWPASAAPDVDAGHYACAQLRETDRGPISVLQQLPVPVQPLSAGVSVNGGSGALARATSGGTLGATRLVTDAGRAFGLGGDASDTLTRLGYTAQDVHVIPQPWLSLVPTGTELSADAAWKTVKQQ